MFFSKDNLFTHLVKSFLKPSSLTKISAAIAMTLTLGGSAALAQNQQPPARSGNPPSASDPTNPNGKLDVSDLENKYWAAKDTDFSVVQNRLYSKAGRFALTGSFGNLVNDPWSNGQIYSGSASYFFNERWGVEASYSAISPSPNQAVQKLNSQYGTPDYNTVGNFYGAQVDWVPFYAKMSVLNWAIVYFDLQFGVGGGMQTYTQKKSDGDSTQSTPAVTLDVIQNFFLSKHFAVRLDLQNRWYSETTVKYNLSNGSHPSNGSDTNNATFLLFGLTVFF